MYFTKILDIHHIYKCIDPFEYNNINPSNFHHFMGVFITIGPHRVLPSQDTLNKNTLLHIFSCYRDQKLDRLPPPPIVREHPITKMLITIDGHNLLAINTSLGKDTRVYVASSPTDVLEGESEAIQLRNQDLHEKFDKVLELVSPKNTFKSLLKKYNLGKRI
jgi:hypothetical protein